MLLEPEMGGKEGDTLLQAKPELTQSPAPPAWASPARCLYCPHVGRKGSPPGFSLMGPHPPLLLSIPTLLPSWVFLYEKAYQVRDTAIESSVVTKVKGFGRYANRVMDVSDYVTPPQVWSPHPHPGIAVWMPRHWAG